MAKLTTRRGMLGSLGALLGGGALGAAIVRETSNMVPERKVLRSSDLRFTRPGTPAGELAASGASALPSGTLEDESGGYAGLLTSTRSSPAAPAPTCSTASSCSTARCSRSARRAWRRPASRSSAAPAAISARPAPTRPGRHPATPS